jgi:hypothetical protein
MAAVGTVTPQKAINERGQRLWSTKLVIPTETTGITKQSQDIGVNGILGTISCKAPNLATDTTYDISLKDSAGELIGKLAAIADNSVKRFHATDLLETISGSVAGQGIPTFRDDYLVIDFATAQEGGSLDFEIVLRGV